MVANHFLFLHNLHILYFFIETVENSLMNITDYSEIWKIALDNEDTSTSATTPTSTAANIKMINSFFYIVTIAPFILVK